MSQVPTNQYHHTQRAPFFLLLYAVAAAMGTAAVAGAAGPPELSYFFLAMGVVFALVGTGFHYLAVMEEGDYLRIQFGPLPLFSKAIRFSEIQSFARDRTTLMEGWGIHKSTRGGWVWNIWGRDCVVIEHDGITRVGTDDVDGLLAFLSRKTGISPEEHV